MKSYASPFAFIVIVLFFPSCATVKLSGDEQDALKVLQRYLALDRNGARADGTRDAAMAALTTWNDEQDWEDFFVYSQHVISRPQLESDKVKIRVRYDVDGVMRGTEYNPLDTETSESTEFILISTADGWKIESPTIPPHVGFSAARKYANEIGATNAAQVLSDAEYIAKLKGARAGHCNCERLDF
ncbi:MAG: hypothetical protein IT366_08895 [Candidatus Hydrogenedentes bacterium]|nr:hypothetical protein [Candidatus Hydrogenedentota bacterium]